MKEKSTLKKLIPSNKNGFALISSLMIMMLLMLVALAMLSLSSTSTNSISSNKGITEARANARMALMIAIGELQQQMGPDQRISANANILSLDSSGNEVTVAHPHWTGVWDSWKAGTGETSQHSTIGDGDEMSPTYETNRRDYFRGWLLSLNPDDLNTNNALNVSLPVSLSLDGQANPSLTDTAVRLVGEGSLGSAVGSADDYVSARLISVSDPADPTEVVGRYGWWIGDESQKARLMPDSYLSGTLSSADKIYRSLASGSMGNTTITGLESMNSEAEIEKVSSLKSFDLIDLSTPPEDDDPKVSQLNFHNSSLYSQGVLADVREGGLKRDLSTLLERTIDRSEDGDEFMLYAMDDPRFSDRSHSRVPIQDLAAYYQLYDHQAAFDNGRREGVHNTSPILADSLQLHVPDYDGGSKDRQRVLREYTTIYRQPVLTKVQFLLVISAVPITAEERQEVLDKFNSGARWTPDAPMRDSDTHKLVLGIMPMITFWNPTNLPLVMDGSQTIRVNKPPPVLFQWRKFREGGEVVTGSQFSGCNIAKGVYGNQSLVGGGYSFLNLRIGGSGTNSVVFEPGEVKVFSADPDDGPNVFDEGRASVFNGVQRSTINNFDPFAFFRMSHSAPSKDSEAPDFFSTNTASEAGAFMVFNRNDRISFQVTHDIGRKGNWADAKSVAVGSGYLVGSAFTIEMIDPGYEANWRDKLHAMRHYTMTSRSGGHGAGTRIDNAIADKMEAFHRELMGPAFPNGAAPIAFSEYLNAIKCSDLIDSGLAEEATGLLEFSLSLGCEAGTISVGGFGGGRNLASRPFLHSAAGAPPFIDQADKASLYDAGWDWKIGTVNNIEDSMVRAKPNTGNGYYGGGYTVESGTTHLIQREIPVLPPISIASLSHAQLGGFSLGYAMVVGDDADDFPVDRWSTRYYRPIGTDYQKTSATGQGGLAPHVMQATGNSYAHPNIPAESAFTTKTRHFDGDEGPVDDIPFVDHSYLANKALWDEFFFSSIAPQPMKIPLYGSSSDRSANQVAADFFFNDIALPNRRIHPYGDSLTQTKLDTLFTEADTYTNGLADKIASHLMVNGVFNVNTTSVDAWKVFLSSLKGKPVAYLKPEPVNPTDPESNTKVTQEEAVVEGTTFSPGILPNAAPIKTADITGPKAPVDQWKSGRELTDEDIEQLSVAIVKQVKMRGPFLSLSEFVNRRLDDSNLPFSLKGALQAALDDENVAINANFRTAGRMLDAETASITGFEFPDAAKGPIAYGSAPYVDQADVLKHFSAQLTPRGDTFVIRTYGDSLDASGKVVARAWCEAVVQRVPEYVNSADAPHLKQADPALSAESKQFGRKIQIISFRWLNADEV